MEWVAAGGNGKPRERAEEGADGAIVLYGIDQHCVAVQIRYSHTGYTREKDPFCRDPIAAKGLLGNPGNEFAPHLLGITCYGHQYPLV